MKMITNNNNQCRDDDAKNKRKSAYKLQLQVQNVI